MGEKEQGGMLRNVIILGLIALIAAVVIGAVIGLNHKMNVLGTNTVNHVDRVGKAYNNKYEVNQHFEKYVVNVGGWHGKYLPMPNVGIIKPGQWREVHFDTRSKMDLALNFDINAYSANQPDDKIVGNDWDDVSKRSIQVTSETGEEIKPNQPNGYQPKYDTKANVTYHWVVKYYNNRAFDLKDEVNGHSSSSVNVVTDGKAFDIDVTNFEAATYNEDIE